MLEMLSVICTLFCVETQPWKYTRTSDVWISFEWGITSIKYEGEWSSRLLNTHKHEHAPPDYAICTDIWSEHTHTHILSVSNTLLSSNILDGESHERHPTRTAGHRKTFMWSHLTDDRSVIELLASPRRAQTRTATEAGGQHRQHRCSRPTHSKTPRGM